MHSGEVGFRICDDVANFLSKSMLPLEFCDRIDAHARILERSVSESVMHSQTFFTSWISRKRSGEVGFRICDDVSHSCAKSMLPLEFCGTIDAHARILEGSVSEFRGLTANAADLNVEARDRGFMLTLTQCFT